MDAKVSVDVSQLVRETIEIEVAKALTRNPKELVEAVVQTALGKEHSYDSKTIFQKAVDEMIRKAATEAMQEWLNEHRKVIKEAVINRLKRAPESFANEIAEQVVIGMAKNFYITANLKLGE